MTVSELLDLLRGLEDEGHGDATVTVDSLEIGDLSYNDTMELVELIVDSPLPDMMPEEDDEDDIEPDAEYYYDNYEPSEEDYY